MIANNFSNIRKYMDIKIQEAQRTHDRKKYQIIYTNISI